MREIKFRIFDKQEEEFLNEEDYAINFVGTIFKACLDEEVFEVLDADMYIVTQYTGLEDKNGLTEIYEGDIVNFTLFDYQDNDTQYLGKIVYIYSGFYIEYLTKGELSYIELSYVLSQDDELEVIGNIYEHSHLLDNN